MATNAKNLLLKTQSKACSHKDTNVEAVHMQNMH